MTKRLHYSFYTIFVLIDVLITYLHLPNWQLVIRPSILILLFVIWYHEKRELKFVFREYALISFYLVSIIIELIYIDSHTQHILTIDKLLIFKFALLIYIVLSEDTFYIRNQSQFIITSLFLATISILISLIIVKYDPTTFLDEIVAGEIGFVASIVLFRRTNKKSYEQLVFGVMMTILAIMIGAINTHTFDVFTETIYRIPYAVGNLFITFGILQGMIYEKG